MAGELGVAFLWVLERLSPDERAAFLLRQVFDYDYSEVAVLRPMRRKLRASAAPVAVSGRSAGRSWIPISKQRYARHAQPKEK
eukprot:gene25959-29325_t